MAYLDVRKSGYRSPNGKYVIEGQWDVRDVYLYNNSNGEIIKKINLSQDSEFYQKHQFYKMKKRNNVRVIKEFEVDGYKCNGFSSGYGPFLFLNNYFIVTKEWEFSKYPSYPTIRFEYTEVFIYNLKGELEGYRLFKFFNAVNMVQTKEGVILQGGGYKKMKIGGI